MKTNINSFKQPERKVTKIGIGHRRPHISLSKALEKEYEVKGTIVKSGKFKGNIMPKICVPQILIGHKVKLILVDKRENKNEE